jgi:hypothetical protein
MWRTALWGSTDIAMIDIPMDLNEITAARIAAEQAGEDAGMLQMRDLELAHLGLPPVIDGARRSRLLATDAISTTWEAWNLSGGERLFLRCTRPRWTADPVILRRMAQGANTHTSWHPSGDWPHLRLVANGALLTDRFPVEDVASTERLARTLGEGLRALSELHERGQVHGGPLAPFFVESPGSLRLVHLDAFDVQTTPADDLRELAWLIVAMDPLNSDPVAMLAEEWVDSPPPTAADGIRLLKRCLGGVLLAERHRLSIAARSANRLDRKTRLARAVRKMAQIVPPPEGKVCIKADVDGALVMVESESGIIRGGAVADATSSRFLPIIYSSSQGLDAQSARFLLRSWALRKQGDENTRAEIQASLAASDSQAEQLIRWMSAMARLRAARLILRVG